MKWLIVLGLSIVALASIPGSSAWSTDTLVLGISQLGNSMDYSSYQSWRPSPTAGIWDYSRASGSWHYSRASHGSWHYGGSHHHGSHYGSSRYGSHRTSSWRSTTRQTQFHW